MDRDELRARQAPLKQRYAAEPEAALVTLTADGSVGEGVACSVTTGRALAEAGLHPASGGDGSLLCSGDMLLEALVACAGVTLRAVATSLGIEVRSGEVRAEGDLDFRGTLGVDREAPVGFAAIRLTVEIDTDADEDTIATLARLTERYCVVYQTLTGGATLSTRVGRPDAMSAVKALQNTNPNCGPSRPRDLGRSSGSSGSSATACAEPPAEPPSTPARCSPDPRPQGRPAARRTLPRDRTGLGDQGGPMSSRLPAGPSS
jgi:uncharacterized OsmC-like protein